MPIIHRLTSYCSTDVLLTLTAVLSAVVVFHVFAYFKDTPGLRSFPGPFLAKFTDAWMFSVVSGNRWSTTVESLHKQYGTSLHTQSSRRMADTRRSLQGISSALPRTTSRSLTRVL